MIVGAILENFQTDEGVRIPEPLRKYLPGLVKTPPTSLRFRPPSKDGFAREQHVLTESPACSEPDFIPFTKELPKDSTSQKTKAKAEKPVKQKVAGAAAAAVDAVGKAAEKLKDVKV